MIRRRTRTWLATTLPQSPAYFSMSFLYMKRQAGLRSPSMRTRCLSLPSFSVVIAFSRHSAGIRRKGSSFMGEGNSPDVSSAEISPVFSRLTHLNV
jgi:hypothetical protein